MNKLKSKFNDCPKYTLALNLKFALRRCGIDESGYLIEDDAPIDYHVDFKPCIIEIIDRELTTNEIAIIDILSNELCRRDYSSSISS